MQAPLVIGLDVGGTKILSGLVDRDGNVVAEHEVDSPGEPEEGVLHALDAAVETLLDDRASICQSASRTTGVPRRSASGSWGRRGGLRTSFGGHAADRLARELYGTEADAHVLIERARAGEQQARAALAAIGASLGAAIGSLVNIFDPELVVLGGGFGAAAGDLVLEPARAAARGEAVRPANTTLRIVAAELGADAGLAGAVLVGFEALDGLR